EPIQATYRGWTVLEQPPVSQGLIVLIALKVLEALDPASDPADRVHLQVEAHKLALTERLTHVGDPAFSPTVVEHMISAERVHALNSVMLVQDGLPRVVGGTPGSFWQVQTNLQLISNLIDLGMPLQAAIDAPRWTMGGQTSWSDSSLNLEARFGETVLRSLRERGHSVEPIGDWAAEAPPKPSESRMRC